MTLRHSRTWCLLFALSTVFVHGCGSSSSSDAASNTDQQTDDGSEPNDDSGSDNDTDLIGYQNATWFSLSAQACTSDDASLIINNGSDVLNQSSDDLSCHVTLIENELVYSIEWIGDDIDRDGVNDLMSFDLRVAGFSGATYVYSDIAADSIVSALGSSQAVNVGLDVAADDADLTASVWDVTEDDSAEASVGQASGQSLHFEIDNIYVSASGYQANFNGFNVVELMETNGGRDHNYIFSEGFDADPSSAVIETTNNLPSTLLSGSFSTETVELNLIELGLEAVNAFTLTGGGDFYSNRTWGVKSLQFSFSTNNPDLTTVWSATDLSVHGTGPTYTEIYPAQETARQALFPAFSWASVPRWLAVRNADAYSDEQIESIANNYQLVMLEKANKAGFDTIDEGIKNTAARLKVINPAIKNIFYWNTAINYTGYSVDAEYAANADTWGELNEDGSIYLFKDLYYWYDHSVPALREWWVNFPVDVAQDDNIDGVFIDKMPLAAVDQLFVDGEPVSDYVNMINALWENLPDDKLLIGNNLRGERNNGSRAMMEILDGSYLERWDFTLDYDFPTQTTADAISLSMQFMREALAQGKLINFQTNPHTDEVSPESYEDRLVYLADHVDFPLAVFLIVAEENAFFSYQEGVNAHPSAEVIWDTSYINELSRPLGEPLGAPIKTGYIYTRSYEYVDVWVNVQTKESVLTWRDAPETQN